MSVQVTESGLAMTRISHVQDCASIKLTSKLRGKETSKLRGKETSMLLMVLLGACSNNEPVASTNADQNAALANLQAPTQIEVPAQTANQANQVSP
jgi:hypothetical protein